MSAVASDDLCPLMTETATSLWLLAHGAGDVTLQMGIPLHLHGVVNGRRSRTA